MSRDTKLWVAIVALVVLLVVSQCAAGEAIAVRDARLDSIRAEEIALRSETLGWETRFAEEMPALARALQSARDSSRLLVREKAELAREIELLGGRVAAMVDMYAEARGQIEAHEAIAHRADAAAVPDSITGRVADGLLTARVKATVEPPTVGIPSYSVTLALALGLSETPDGRVLATARASDPRVALRYGDVYYDPPDPLRVCSLGQRLEAGLWGFGIGATMVPLVQLVRGLVGGGG